MSVFGGKVGVIGVLGVEFRYTAPGKFDLDITGGFGAALSVHIFGVGANVSKLTGGSGG